MVALRQIIVNLIVASCVFTACQVMRGNRDCAREAQPVELLAMFESLIQVVGESPTRADLQAHVQVLTRLLEDMQEQLLKTLEKSEVPQCDTSATERADVAAPVFPSFCSEEQRDTTWTQQHMKDFHFKKLRGLLEADAPLVQRLVQRHPKYYCDKLDVGRRFESVDFPEPSTDAQDLVIGVFTSNGLCFSRAMAARDTWLRASGSPFFFFTADANPVLPSVGLPSVYPERFRVHPKFKHPIGELFFWGLHYLLERHPGASWFYMLGDDSWVDTRELRLELDEHTAPAEECTWVTPNGGGAHTLKGRLLRAARHFNYTRASVPVISGGIGTLVSRGCVAAITRSMEEFREAASEPDSPGVFGYANDVEVAALLAFLGHAPVPLKKLRIPKRSEDAAEVRPFHLTGGAMDRSVRDLRAASGSLGLLMTHYVYPMKQFSLEQWRTRRLLEWAHLKRPRLLPGLVAEFVDAHFDTLRNHARTLRFIETEKAARGTFKTDAYYDVPEPDDDLEGALEEQNVFTEKLRVLDR